jgi:hypothetical protein
MSIETILKSHTIQPKVFFRISLAVVALLLALHLFMLFAVFPDQAGFMNLHIPSRSGGYDLPVTTEGFTSLSSIILSVAAGVAGVVSGMIHSKKDGLAIGTTFLLLFSAAVYTALYVGSATYALWGGLGATLGVIGVVAIGFALELPLLMWMNQNLKKK